MKVLLVFFTLPNLDVFCDYHFLQSGIIFFDSCGMNVSKDGEI